MNRAIGARKTLLLCAVFVTTFVSRLGAIGRYVTPDEYAWVFRSIRFRHALLSGNLAETIQAPHPGVITTWIGTIGIQLTLLFNPQSADSLATAQKLAWAHTQSGEVYTHLIPFLTGSRITLILIFSAGLTLIAWLLAKRTSLTVAAIGVGFVALDPWISGLSGLLHVDALMSLFCLIAILILLTADELSPKHLIATGVATSCAILSKLPGVLLLVFIPALLLAIQIYKHEFQPGTLVKQGLWWLAGLIPALILLLPALVVAPNAVLQTIVENSNQEINIQAATFFMGESRFEVGPQFYPLALFIRLSPITTLGCIIGLWQLATQKLSRNALFSITTLALFSVLFGCGMALSSRQFTRYMLPVSILITLGAGLAVGNLYANFKQSVGAKWIAVTFAAQFLWMAWLWPTPLAAANLFTGGPWQLHNQLPAGWQDGASQAARHASQLSNGQSRRLFTTNVPAAASFYAGPIYRLSEETANLIRENDLIIIDQNQAQLNRPNFVEQYLNDGHKLLHTVRTGGVDTAWLLAARPSQLNVLANQADVRAAAPISLIHAAIFQIPNRAEIVVQTNWQSSAGQDYNMVIYAKDGQDNVWSTVEYKLVGNSGLPAEHWSPEKTEEHFATLSMPPATPPGEYEIAIELFDSSGNRSGLFTTDGRFLGSQSTLVTLHYTPPQSEQVELPENAIPLSAPLIATTSLPTTLKQGSTAALNLWWEHTDSTEGTLDFQLKIGESVLSSPINVENYQTGKVYRHKPKWRIPADFPPGEWPLSLGLAPSDQPNDFSEIGMITIEAENRNFSLPVGTEPINIQFGTLGRLQQAQATVSDQLNLSLTWQASEDSSVDYTMFVHVRDDQGNVIDQIDRPPAKSTAAWVTNEVIVDQLSFEATDEAVEIAIGLYDPNSGERIPVFSADGTPLPDRQFIVDVSNR